MASDPEKLSEPPKTPLTVLIADDDPPTRILLRAAITQWGYKVIAAQDGEEAWDVLQKPDAPKLLILDWLMPKLNGLDLCHRIKQELKTRPYIILLTQVTGTENIVKGLEAGADEFLSKPFNMAELNSRLSVGARIIEFDNTLTLQHKKLQAYHEQFISLTEMALKLTKEIEQVISGTDALQAGEALERHKSQLKQLSDDLKQVTDLVAQIKL
jgi:DNA-binding response OmpR family regulator